ncbi:uncharacterized protein [Ptychodera flava]|uniref:uncharacterized protein n=1 Tax=Ptychodera flava TaxID=63121 RepID=UPI00396A4417
MDIARFDERKLKSKSDSSSQTHPEHFPRKMMVGIGVGYLFLSFVCTSIAICLLMLNCEITISLPWIANALYMTLMGCICLMTTRRRSRRYIYTSLLLSAVYIPLSYLAYMVVLIVRITEIYTCTCHYIVWIYLIAAVFGLWPAFRNIGTCDNILRDKDKTTQHLKTGV